MRTEFRGLLSFPVLTWDSLLTPFLHTNLSWTRKCLSSDGFLGLSNSTSVRPEASFRLRKHSLASERCMPQAKTGTQATNISLPWMTFSRIYLIVAGGLTLSISSRDEHTEPAFALHDVCADSCILCAKREGGSAYVHLPGFYPCLANTDCPDTTSAVMRRCGESWAQTIDKRLSIQGRTRQVSRCLSTPQNNQTKPLPTHQNNPTSHSTHSAHHGPHTLNHHRRKAQPHGPPNRQKDPNRPRHGIHVQKPSHRHHDHHPEDNHPPQRRRPPRPRRKRPSCDQEHRHPHYWCSRPCDYEPYNCHGHSAPQADDGGQGGRDDDEPQG